jgi:hypothetical protein
MSYRVFYEKRPSSVNLNRRAIDATRTEEFGTEQEALGRTRELLEKDEHDGVLVCDGSGNILCGVRLQLKLGYTVE